MTYFLSALLLVSGNYLDTSGAVGLSSRHFDALAFYQVIEESETLDRPRNPRFQDPYDFIPSELTVLEGSIKFGRVKSTYYWSEIKVPQHFSYSGFHTRLDTKRFFIQHAFAEGDHNVTLGAKRGGLEVDYTIGDVRPVQNDDQYFQSSGFHARYTVRF